MSQYALSLSLPPVFSEANFFVSACNREAHEWISRWPDWPAHALLMYGPKGSGKSHLGHIWAIRAGAEILEASALPETPANHPALIENVEQLKQETHLLHWFNTARENKQSLLLTSALPPVQLPFKLPDLTSRLLSIPHTAIAEADDEALSGAMRKQFADRQLKVNDEVIAYLLPRMERSFSAVTGLVDMLDKAALREQRTLSIPFIKRVLQEP